MTYAGQMNDVEDIVRKLQNCTDVDEAMRMFERGTACLEDCERRIESARGKFSELTQHK